LNSHYVRLGWQLAQGCLEKDPDFAKNHNLSLDQYFTFIKKP